MSILIVSDTGATCLFEEVAPQQFQVRIRRANGRTMVVWSVVRIALLINRDGDVTERCAIQDVRLRSFLFDLANKLGRAGFSIREAKLAVKATSLIGLVDVKLDF